MKTKNKFVKSVKELIKFIEEGHTEYALILAGGLCHSKKTINYDKKKKKFKIINHIDDSKIFLTEKQIMDEESTLIGKAMPLNSLVVIIN